MPAAPATFVLAAALFFPRTYLSIAGQREFR
jgi:hypothetical protein